MYEVNGEVLAYLYDELAFINVELVRHKAPNDLSLLRPGDEGFMVTMEEYDFLQYQQKYLLDRINWLEACPIETV